jgi:ParB-like chromosome segregation protein Spo0J
MAVSFSQDTISRGDSLYVDYPENILVEPELNGRHEHTDVEALAADIAQFGQRTPCVIRKNDAGLAVLVFGHRRYRSVALLNERNPNAKRKLICKYEKLSDAEAFVAAIGENRFRRDVSPIDDCANICLLKTRFGKSESDIAAIYFPEAPDAPESLRFVKQRAALDELAPEAALAVREGRVKLTAAVALAKLSKDQQRARVKGEGKVKGSDVAPSKPKPPIKVDVVVQAIDTELRRLVAIILEDVSQVALNDDERRYVEVDRESMSEYMS